MGETTDKGHDKGWVCLRNSKRSVCLGQKVEGKKGQRSQVLASCQALQTMARASEFILRVMVLSKEF